jgi:hypothetical protein
LVGWGALGAAQVKQQADRPRIVMWLPNKGWTLVFDAPGYKIGVDGLQPDGRNYFLAANKSTEVTISVYLEKVLGKATADGCKHNREQRPAQNSGYKKESIEKRESSGMTILEYTIAEFKGVPVQQRNLFACLAKDDVYVDIHLSKMLFKASEEELFTTDLDSAHFVDKTSSN